MRKVNDFEVVGPPDAIDQLVKRIDERADDHWRRDREAEERLRKMLSSSIRAYCFSNTDASGGPIASAWFERVGPRRMALTNVVPGGRNGLTDEKYNSLIENFDDTFIRPLADGLGVESRIIPPEARIERALSHAALTDLRRFSSSADRDNPQYADVKMWEKFLVRSHIDGSSLEWPDLEYWLEKQGWSEETRKFLAELYDMGFSLLAEYDEERVHS